MTSLFCVLSWIGYCSLRRKYKVEAFSNTEHQLRGHSWLHAALAAYQSAVLIAGQHACHRLTLTHAVCTGLSVICADQARAAASGLSNADDTQAFTIQHMSVSVYNMHADLQRLTLQQ